MIEGYLSDILPPLKEWPLHALRRFLGKHLGFNDRCCLVYFLAANGAPPCLIPMWAKCQAGWLRTDKSALHMASLIEAWRKGEFEGENGKELKTAWCMENQQLITVYTPTFAFETAGRQQLDYKPGCTYWSDAVTELKDLARTLPRKKDADIARPWSIPPPSIPPPWSYQSPRPDKVERLNKWKPTARYGEALTKRSRSSS